MAAFISGGYAAVAVEGKKSWPTERVRICLWLWPHASGRGPKYPSVSSKTGQPMNMWPPRAG
eukprot:4125019-Heterocapsa_arctica.AAC.1